MAKLKTSTRNELPKSAPRQTAKRGKLSPEAAARIRKKANKICGNGEGI